ncbi:MAG: acetyl-CoA carboxylase, carboxyltransferase subunit beta [Parachlamydiales bacterium]|jgi:acetyl-CoA carboxylase carboxyl transferase subunit beta
MGLFSSRSKPKIKVETIKKDGFSGWIKCSGCSEMIHAKELQENLNCCPKCNYHYQMTLQARLDLICDPNTFEEKFSHLKPADPLNFVDSETYPKRVQKALAKSQSSEAIVVGEALIDGQKTALGVMDFSFMGGSMGSVVGEKIVLLIEEALEKKLPLVLVTASGGARMQESILSLMQMAKTAAALTRLSEARLPYIAVLTHPTTGGVTASFASLGDIILAEPGALIAFAGPRVVEQTIGEKLPEGAQKAEFLLEKGMLDAIVKRSDLKKKLAYFIGFLSRNEEKKASLSDKLKELLEAAEVVNAK